ncbi:unnamed protein product [Rotaria sp. Silwood2]|nr:unnamed protein product [Rotaria sp. Silwood2]
MDFMLNTIEYSKSYKNFRNVDETRDVPESHYVCQWWVQQLQGIKIESNSNKSCLVKKKHRDQIRWNNAALPFRRSGLWMAIKVVFHAFLNKHLGDVGTVVYKLLITHFLTYVIDTRKHSADFNVSTDLLVHCRLNKIESLLISIETNHIKEWVRQMKQQI